jgi:steroid 5-alpha reductase family enzyme
MNEETPMTDSGPEVAQLSVDGDKDRSLAWVQRAYLVSFAVALGIGCALVNDGSESTIIIALAADLVATLCIFSFSRLFRNSSMYDPYWSVAPPLIALFWAFSPETDEVSVARRMLVTGLVLAWSIRLTYNWVRGWPGLDHEDWRYADLREKWGDRFWVIDLAGIHFFPTIQVFLGCLVLYPALSTGTRALNSLDLVALLVTSLGIWFEMTADRQLHTFVSTRTEDQKILNSGLWAYTRHPNYFGELLFWWGLYFFALAADPGSYWWTFIGPLAISVMFSFVSIPLLEERNLRRRPEYAEHQRKVSSCIPWLPRK